MSLIEFIRVRNVSFWEFFAIVYVLAPIISCFVKERAQRKSKHLRGPVQSAKISYSICKYIGEQNKLYLKIFERERERARDGGQSALVNNK